MELSLVTKQICQVDERLKTNLKQLAVIVIGKDGRQNIA